MELLAQWILIFFGIFLMGVGFLMLLYPSKARKTIKKAGSTPFINYSEITIRMIPAAALIVFAEYSKFPLVFHYLGWFMLLTSLVLYFVPRRIHHQYAVTCADILNPMVIRCISPFSFLFGIFIMYSILS